MENNNCINFYFIRHAESEANIDTRNIIGGRNIGVPLSHEGVKQAEALGYQLKNEGIVFNNVFTSTALRTQDTAKIVLSIMGYTDNINTSSDLLEQGAGDWEGQSREIYNRPDVRYSLDRDNWNYVPGDNQPGESQSMVARRMIQWLNQPLSYYGQFPGVWNIAVFTHGLAIKFLMAQLLNLNRNTAYKIPIDNTSVTLLQFVNGQLILPMKRSNDTSHYSFIKE